MPDRSCSSDHHEPVLHSERVWYKPFRKRYYLACAFCEMAMIPEPTGMVYNMLSEQLREREARGMGISNYKEASGGQDPP